MTPAVVVLELNELAPHLLRRWIGLGLLPGFARLFNQSSVYTTHAEHASGSLQPWIQWVTVHSGLDANTHKVFEPHAGYKLKAPRLWDMVTAAGGSSWICGSMNTGVSGTTFNGSMLADLSSDQASPYAPDLEEFVAFVRTYLDDKKQGAIHHPSFGEAVRFTRLLTKNGLSKETIRTTARVLFSRARRSSRGRRRALLNRLMWDLFRSRWQSTRPHLATVLLNAPDRFEDSGNRAGVADAGFRQPGTDEQVEYSQAVLDGYKVLDGIVTEALQMADESSINLVLMTALSQQSLMQVKPKATSYVYRPNDPLIVMALAGVELPVIVEPSRTEESRLVFESTGAASKAFAGMQALRLDGEKLLQLRLDGHNLYLSCELADEPSANAVIKTEQGYSVASFADMFQRIRDVRALAEHCEGMFWMRPIGGGKFTDGGRVPLRQVSPTIALLAGLSRSDISYYFELPPLGWLGAGRSDRRLQSRSLGSA